MVKKSTKSIDNQSLILSITRKKIAFLDTLSPFGLVMLRIWIALVFWKSGLTKIDNWETTIFLFEEEYKTHEKLTIFGNQIFTPEAAAFFATAGELILPILVIIGLYTRGAAFFLLIMTAVIEFTYQSFAQHISWAVVLGAIILQGSGNFSWDYFIRGKFLGFPQIDSDRDKLFATFGTLCLSIYAGYLIFTGIF